MGKRKETPAAAVIAILLGSLLGASSGLYIKTLGFSSLAMTGYRMGIPFLFFLPLMIRKKMVLGPPKNRKKVDKGLQLAEYE